MAVAGIRGGYDYDAERWSAGGQIRVPLGWRGLQVIPSGDVFFLHRDTVWQGNVDVALRPGGRGRMYAGGGLAVTDMYGDGSDEKVSMGYNLMIGSPLSLRGLPIRMYLEARWTYVNDRSPFRVAIGLSWPLGRRRRSIF